MAEPTWDVWVYDDPDTIAEAPDDQVVAANAAHAAEQAVSYLLDVEAWEFPNKVHVRRAGTKDSPERYVVECHPEPVFTATKAEASE